MDKDANLPHVVKALVQVRHGHYADEWGWSYADGIKVARRATLILFGLKGHGTHGHVDWSEANNIAFSFKQVGFCNSIAHDNIMLWSAECLIKLQLIPEVRCVFKFELLNSNLRTLSKC